MPGPTEAISVSNGRYCYDFIHHKDRLTTPLIREGDGYRKEYERQAPSSSPWLFRQHESIEDAQEEMERYRRNPKLRGQSISEF